MQTHFNIKKPPILFRRMDGKLSMHHAQNGDENPVVHIVRCFPWNFKTRYLSIRNEKGNELHLISDIKEIEDSTTKNLILEELAMKSYTPTIKAIHAIQNEIDIYRWKVFTDAGERTFYTGKNDVPRALPGDGVVIKDISGDRYLITDLEKLDKTSRDLLSLYLD